MQKSVDKNALKWYHKVAETKQKGGIFVFREERFKAALVENKLSISDVANALNISKTTLYRKMSGESDFYRAEIQIIRRLIHRENVDDIFFAE